MFEFNDREELTEFIKNNFVTSGEAAEILNCTRANISDLIKRNKIIPAIEMSQTMLFWRDEIEARYLSKPTVGRPRNVKK